MLVLNVLAFVGMTYSVITNLSAQNATSSSGSGFSMPPFNPDLSLAEQFGCVNPADCGCDGPSAALNPACNADALKNLPNQVGKFKKGLADGSIKPADGQTLDEALAQADKALSDLDAALTSIGNEIANDGDGNKGKALITGTSTGGDGDFLSKAKGIGPVDTTGLGKVLWNGKLDMVDDETGKSLTLWQRATRRHQGDKGTRAFILARMEYLRQGAKKKLIADSAPPKAKTPASVQSPKLKHTKY